MNFVYFISYTGRNSTSQFYGRWDLTLNAPITTIEQIAEIEQCLKDTAGLDAACITNYQLLRTEIDET